jgi:hypothetical protein
VGSSAACQFEFSRKNIQTLGVEGIGIFLNIRTPSRLSILYLRSLATALGVWSGGSTLFQATSLLLWYPGPVEGFSILDFLGALNDPLESSVLILFSIAALMFHIGVFIGCYKHLQKREKFIWLYKSEPIMKPMQASSRTRGDHDKKTLKFDI